MVANLFLHPDTFKYNTVDTLEQVAHKLSFLVKDMAIIVNEYNQENRFKVPQSLWLTKIYDSMTICDLAEECLDNDYKGVFYTMLSDTSDEYDNISLEELESRCKYQLNEQEVNSILVFNTPELDLSEQKSVVNDYITFDDYQIVYNRKTWMYLRRQILGNHPGSPKKFIDECKKYFPNIIFSCNCTTSLEDDEFKYLEIIPRKIVYYLSCLNDCFADIIASYDGKSVNANTILENFSGNYGLDTPGSIERNSAKDNTLTFTFKYDDNLEQNVLCEHHLKISQADNNYRGTSINFYKFHPRVYFNYTYDNKEKCIIWVGSIGTHL